MKVALIGASGNAGSRILAELEHRGHAVTAIARNPDNVPKLPNVTAKAGDVFDEPGLAAALAGHDAVISSVHFTASDPRKLIEAVRTSGVKRYLVVGGAGSLEVAPGVKLIDTPNFPALYKTEATAGSVFLDLLRQEHELDWTFLSPAAMFIPGERTGTFRLGTDQLLANDKGSSISFEDYAIALVDEVETPKHSRQRVHGRVLTERDGQTLGGMNRRWSASSQPIGSSSTPPKPANSRDTLGNRRSEGRRPCAMICPAP